MINVSEASQIILSHKQNYGVVSVGLIDSLGRVLKEDVLADNDFPPFNRVCMDGIGISFKSFSQGRREYKIEGVQAAGSPQKSLLDPNNCIEVMTGAVLPVDTDVVIPYELIEIVDGVAKVSLDVVTKMQNIHLKGRDKRVGDLLIPKNRKITAAEIGVLATVGKSEVLVAKHPKVLIVSTGDELVEVSDVPLQHQIRRSNVYSLQALLLELGIVSETKHFVDAKESLSKEIATSLEQYDVLLFSGAVSKGKFDFIPEVLETLSVQKLFHRVKQRPGKPFWFGTKVFDRVNKGMDEEKTKNFDTQKQKMVFAFPGNPVSTYVNCLKYFFPWYEKSVFGQESEMELAHLSVDFNFMPSMTYFLQVKLHHKEGVLVASPLKGNGSGDLANLAEADAFLELPQDRIAFKKGELFPVIRYR
jgi:molybdopterin molybdotransferase